MNRRLEVDAPTTSSMVRTSEIGAVASSARDASLTALATAIGSPVPRTATVIALGVVVAAAGYPDEPRKGDAISGLPKPAPDCRVFHAGTRLEGKTVLTNGGRVLCVTALGDSVKRARARAYEALEGIRFEGMQYRKDIAYRALKKTP